MKETKFYMSFMVYIAVGMILITLGIDCVLDRLTNIENYLLNATIISVLIVLGILLVIAISSKLAFITSQTNKKIKADVFLQSFKMMAQGMGIVLIALPSIYLIQNTRWVLQANPTSAYEIIGGILAASLVVIGSILVLAQVYKNIEKYVVDHNSRILEK